jgi:hypothetical protein
LNWTLENTADNHIIHSTVCSETSERAIQSAVDACCEHAFTFLKDNIEDSSMYCLFDWNSSQAQLTVTVTDDTKQQDAEHIVKMTFTDFESVSAEEQEDTVKYWIKDMLTTSLAFLKFSLVAGFTRDSRHRVELL